MRLDDLARSLAIAMRDRLTPAAEQRRLVERLRRDKRLVFCVNPGRAGSAWLAQALSCLDAVEARHEPDPNFVWAMRPAQRWPALAASFWRAAKLPAIAASPKPVYIETSHLFGKGFLEPLLALGLVPDLILLRRDARKVALSYLRLGGVPGRSKGGWRFHLHPGDRVLLPLLEWRDLSDYQLLYWSVLEVEERQRVFADAVRDRGGRVAAFDIDAPDQEGAFRALLAELDLAATAAELDCVRARFGASVNTKPKKLRRAVPVEAELDAEEREVRRRIGAPFVAEPAGLG